MSDRIAKEPVHENGVREIRIGRRATDEVVSADERRSTPRYAFIAAAEVVDVKSRTRVSTRISDLGMEGCYIDTNAPFPGNTNVRIRITTAKHVFKCLGTVVYSLPNLGMGISFKEPEPAQKVILQKWIDELSGVVPADFEAGESERGIPAEFSSIDAQLHVLRDLVTALMRKRTLTEAEGKALLDRLSR